MTVMREEIRWLTQPGPVIVKVAPTIVEGLVGGVEIDKDTVFVYIDIGLNQGIKVGDAFRIYREVSIKTERKTVRVEEDLGEAIVVAVYPEACKAKVIFGADAVARWKDAALRARLVPAPKQQPEQQKETEGEKTSNSIIAHPASTG